MMADTNVPADAILDRWTQHEWTDGIQIDDLPDLETLVVRTMNTLYEIIVISGRTGEILVRGGQFFPELTPAGLAGSSLGGSFLKMRGIYRGFRMELHHNQQPIVTTQVQSIKRVGSAEWRRPSSVDAELN
jgi:hypothetical protein